MAVSISKWLQRRVLNLRITSLSSPKKMTKREIYTFQQFLNIFLIA